MKWARAGKMFGIEWLGQLSAQAKQV